MHVHLCGTTNTAFMFQGGKSASSGGGAGGGGRKGGGSKKANRPSRRHMRQLEDASHYLFYKWENGESMVQLARGLGEVYAYEDDETLVQQLKDRQQYPTDKVIMEELLMARNPDCMAGGSCDERKEYKKMSPADIQWIRTRFLELVAERERGGGDAQRAPVRRLHRAAVELHLPPRVARRGAARAGARAGAAAVEEFDAAGYDVRIPWKVLNAGHYGTPQSRERLILFGARKGKALPNYPDPITEISGRKPNFEELSFGPSCADALGDLPNADDFVEFVRALVSDLEDPRTRHRREAEPLDRFGV